MTNYFGKRRMIKLFYHYISDKTAYQKEFRKEAREFGMDKMFLYERYRGDEWLDCSFYDMCFHFYAFGKSSKVVTMDEKHYDENKDRYVCVTRIVSYFDSDFRPHPNNKDKQLDCCDICKIKDTKNIEA